MAHTQYDVGIIGGGLAGLTLALQLRQQNPDASLAIIERATFPVPEACHKVGESSVEIGAYYFSRIVGLEDHIKQQQLPKFGLRYFFSHGDNQDITERLELGGNSYFPTPSYQFDRGRLENELAERVRAAGVTFIEGTKVRKVELQKGAHKVFTEEAQPPLLCSYLVDASGRAGVVKKITEGHEAVDHDVHSFWFRLNSKLNVDDFSSDESWSKGHEGNYTRWYSTNHFMGKGYWVWLIPLSSGQTSIGIVADAALHPLSSYNSRDKALAWLQRHEPQLASMIQPLMDTMTDFLGVKHFAHSAKEVYSKEGWFLTGEAGIFLDPFYSPGSDFIAMSNTFVADCLTRALQGEDIRQRTGIYNQLYLSYFHNTLPVYLHQYSLFGFRRYHAGQSDLGLHNLLDPTRVLFLQGQLCNLSTFNHIRNELSAIGALNKEMQALFQSYKERIAPAPRAKFIDVTSIPYLLDLNRSLALKLSDEEFVTTFKTRTVQLKELKQLIDSYLPTNESIDSFIEALKNFHATATTAEVTPTGKVA